MKILAAVGIDRFVEENTLTDHGWVKSTILKNDPTGIAIRNILKGNGGGRRIAVEQHQTVEIMECGAAEHINNICRSGYRPDLVVLALNTRILITLEDVERLELERFDCRAVVIVSPDQRHPVTPCCQVIVWDNTVSASERLKTVMNQIAEAVNTREQHERKAKWEAEKKADAATADRVAKMTDEEWRAQQQKEESQHQPTPTEDDES